MKKLNTSDAKAYVLQYLKNKKFIREFNDEGTKLFKKDAPLSRATLYDSVQDADACLKYFKLNSNDFKILEVKISGGMLEIVPK